MVRGQSVLTQVGRSGRGNQDKSDTVAMIVDILRCKVLIPKLSSGREVCQVGPGACRGGRLTDTGS